MKESQEADRGMLGLKLLIHQEGSPAVRSVKRAPELIFASPLVIENVELCVDAACPSMCCKKCRSIACNWKLVFSQQTEK